MEPVKPPTPDLESEQPVAAASTPTRTPISTSKRDLYIGLAVAGVVIIGAGTVLAVMHHKNNNNGSNGPVPLAVTNTQNSSGSTPVPVATASQVAEGAALDYNNPVSLGESLGGNQCVGTGSKPLTSAPLASTDIGVIVPMGTEVGAHVTPIDHQYYYQKNPNAARDTYPVMAPADGKIVSIQHRTQFVGNASANQPQTDEYRIVIGYSCTFFSYYDLLTSLDASVSSKLPADFATTGNMGSTPIPVTAGQVIGHVGGQSLDFAVWDTTKHTTGLLNPTAFNNAEPWKIVTVSPLDYWSDAVKAEILPFYVRQADPRDGIFAYDVDGTAIGDWFLAGTNGYRGGSDAQAPSSYWLSHLAIVPDAIDPSSLIFSVGQYNGGDATQFAIIGNTPDPKTITPTSGIAKYTLAQLTHVLLNGSEWTGSSYSTGITVKAGAAQAVALVQLTDKQTMKVEIFPGKTAAQVTGFDDKVQTYNRGQDATIIASSTAH